MTNKKNKDFDFEKALARISEISVEVEKDDITLEKAILLYEEGAKLKILCDNFLKECQNKIETINKDLQESEENPNEYEE